MKFQDLPLKETLLKAIADRGYETPTDIQAESIPKLATEDVDFVGQAQTGTGKTAAFVLPLLNKIDVLSNSIQAVVLTPTRELANQVCEETKKFATNEKVRTLSVYGGVPIDTQIKGLRRSRPHLIVGTPGRVLDLIRRGILKLSQTKYAILDEADEMLDMGFIDDVKTILSEFSESRKTWMFSATMPRQILGLIQDYLSDPFIVKIKKKTLSNENITQKYFVIKRGVHTEALCRILESIEEIYGIVFCRTRVDAKNVSDELNMRGFSSDALHGDMSQQQRDITMKRFKEKRIKLLVCTDVAARGIDVESLTHVINYGFPQDIESYVHRIGRTGRAGQRGEALSIIDPAERYRVKHIENITKARIEKSNLPTGQDIKKVLIDKELRKLSSIHEKLSVKIEEPVELEEKKVDSFFENFSQKLENVDKDDLVKVMYSYLFRDKLSRYDKKNSLDVPERPERRDSRDSRGVNVVNNGNVRFFLNMGKQHGLTLSSLLETISTEIKVERSKIKNIDMKDTFSFLEVPAKYRNEVLSISNVSINNRSLKFEVTKKDKRSFSRRPTQRSSSSNGSRNFRRRT